MNIGLSYWGFCEKFAECNVANTPDGHRYGRPVLVDDLTKRGHRVYAMQQKREASSYPGLTYADGHFPDIDILFVEWRWPIYKNWGPDKFEPDLDRQTELLDYYHGKIPIVVWDTDLKMRPVDERRWPEMIIADPTFDPKSCYIQRVRLPFWSDFEPLFDAHEGSVEFGYVGNNYEREEMFRKYYSEPSRFLRNEGIQTRVWGNWLQHSPERESPESLIKTHQYIAFADRVSFKESMAILNRFVCTVHITKPRYAEQGFCSPRYLENIVTNTPALVPGEFCYPNILGKYWRVDSAEDVAKRVSELQKLTSQQRADIVNEQRDSLLQVHDFSVSHVSSFLEDAIRDPVTAVKNMR